MNRSRITALVVGGVVLLVVLVVIAATGGDDDRPGTEADDEVPTTVESIEEPDDSGDITDENVASEGDKPQVRIPDGPPPDELVVTDDIVGEGDEVSVGDTITVHYVGVSYADGSEFDSSWDRGSPATFDLVEGGLIQGWVEGIPGMREGGRRTLVIPGSMAYGDEDRGDGRPYGALVFVVDLVAVAGD